MYYLGRKSNKKTLGKLKYVFFFSTNRLDFNQ